MKVGSLFTGIGGLDLGCERAGMEIIWQSEIDPYCCQVLAKHWPDVPNLGDIRAIDWSRVERPDIIVGGYPCQPFSYNGVRRGADDLRHLWPEMFRAIRVLRPDYALMENVAGHLSLGFDAVLADLASIGFDVEWSTVSACSMGAPHARRRLYAVAYTTPHDRQDQSRSAAPMGRPRPQPRRSRRPQRQATWLPEPAVDRVAHGVPSALVRQPLEALGNAVVPQVAEHIAHLILNHKSA